MMSDNISKNDFESAKHTIKLYEKQVNKERTTLFKKSLMEYDNTYWKYSKPMETIFMSALVKDRSILVTRFIKHSNGILEIKTTHFDKESIDNYLRTLSEFSHSELFDEPKNYLFEKITHNKFKTFVNQHILSEMNLILGGRQS